MNRKLIAAMILATLTVFTNCGGNNTAKNPPDTTGNSVDTPTSVDTSKTTTTTGDVPNLDNSGSGGTNIDTVKNRR